MYFCLINQATTLPTGYNVVAQFIGQYSNFPTTHNVVAQFTCAPKGYWAMHFLPDKSGNYIAYTQTLLRI